MVLNVLKDSPADIAGIQQYDVITAIDGVAFEDAWKDRVGVDLGDVRAFVLSRTHLIANKRASGRLQDLADLERLEQGEAS
jgi:S1-C subfamily serine protease